MKAIDNVNREILDNLYDGVLVFDNEKKIAYCNRGIEKMVGLKNIDVVGSHCRDVLPHLMNHSGRNICEEMCPVVKTVADGNVRENKGYLRQKKNGENLPVLIRVAPIKNMEGTIVGAVKVLSDNSAEVTSRQKIAELQRLVLIDSLTSLANRRYIEMNLVARLDELDRYDWPFGVLFFDIDHFKKINDQYGHDFGDEVLKSLASVLRKNSRSFDLIGRLGGEEFVVNLVNINEELLLMIAERLRKKIEQTPITKGEITVHTAVSIGATLARKDDTVESLLRRADALMYQSKRAGRNCVSIGS